MIIARCANGVVGFKVAYVRETDSLQWNCINDNSSGVQKRVALGYQQLLTDMVSKAVSLKGSIQQVIDLPEIF